MYRDVLGFSITPHMQRVMVANGCYASIMRTEKKAENSGKGLPPGVPIPLLPVDYLEVRPDHWIGGEGSYVCPVDSDWALWFNWSMNNTSDTAVLASVKGMNPLTGQRMGSYDLETYGEECPVHKERFSTGKLCLKCGFKWPEQNFVSTPNPAYMDGYRMPDGNVRQFYFTEEMMKSIPEQVIGKEDTVPAFGFCFYRLRDRRTNYEGGTSYRDEFPIGHISQNYRYSSPGSYSVKGSSVGEILTYFSSSAAGEICSPIHDGGEICPPVHDSEVTLEKFLGEVDYSSESRERGISFSNTAGTGDVVREALYKAGMSESDAIEAHSRKPIRTVRGPKGSELKKRSFSTTRSAPTVRAAADSASVSAMPMVHEIKDRSGMEVGLGAGAKIKQGFGKAAHGADKWEEKPTGVMRVYFVFQEEFEKYAAGGFKNLEGKKAGYLEGLDVGGAK